ncbi:MAG TPA: DUF420 domain-containing protein, partial [Polyangiaceae bacterium]|nr:DUF420 domain-containing protein [Polyangiaceae bacterium]
MGVATSDAEERVAISAPRGAPPPAWLWPALTAASLGCVLVMQLVFPSLRSDVGRSRLPALNAGLNLAATLSLLVGYRFIRQGRIRAHRRSMLFAFGLSVVFLVSYVVHHAQVGSVRYI